MAIRNALVAVLLLSSSPAAAQPQINPSAVRVVRSPNTLSWPVTARIQSIEVTEQGVRLTFDKCDQWPNVTPPGWGGPLRFTLHLFLNIGGEWWESGIIQYWACDQYSGGARRPGEAPIYADNQIAKNWVYDNSWGNMVGHQPAPGERIGFMVSAGNARGQDDHLARERSDIVELAMPSGPMSYPPFLATEGAAPPPPIPTPPPPPPPIPIPPPPPIPTPPPLPSTDLSPALNLMTVQHAAVMAAIADVKKDLAEWRATVTSTWEKYAKPILKWGSVFVLGLLARWGATASS